MRRAVSLLLLFGLPAFALDQGELRFGLAGHTYSTRNAQALIQKKGDKSRILIAVKDISQRFMLLLTADVPAGSESSPLELNTENAALGVSLRTPQGTLAVLPQVQLAKPTNITYTERVEVVSEDLEDDVAVHAHGHQHGRHKRKKIRSEYRRVKPRWHTMSREERIRTGEGIIENGAFKDTHFILRLIPVVENGTVKGLQGTFSGTGRFSRSISGAEVKPLENGAFNVKVEYGR